MRGDFINVIKRRMHLLTLLLVLMFALVTRISAIPSIFTAGLGREPL